MRRYLAFGLQWESAIHLAQFAESAPSQVAPDIHVGLIAAAPAARQAGVRWGRSEVYADGFRFHADQFAIFDFFAPDRLVVVPGAAWVGQMPGFFYGTVAAAIVAFNNGIPMHGSAVQMHGSAMLVCGRSGLGKSSIAAGLVRRGASLISDDLSCLYFDEHKPPRLYAGRTNVRLGAAAAQLAADAGVPSTACGQSAAGKHLMAMPMTDPGAGIALTSLVFLGVQGQTAPCQDDLRAHRQLMANFFRPGLMGRLPGHATRIGQTMNLDPGVRIRELQVRLPLDGAMVEAMAQHLLEFHCNDRN
ncbi:MAG: hypothetical protein V4484_08215 [Pseudomonadota bacterium]